MKRRRHQAGFSLLELLIVVTVILIISAIAIPNLLRSRMAANEAAAVGTLRTVNSSCIAYSSNWGTGYPVSLSNLGPAKPATAIAADLVDSTVAGGTKSGYALTYVSSAPTNGKIWIYTINANPVVPGQTGGRYFFTDQSGVIRYNSGAAATISSPPIS
jgi:prepilin-type N-terminal cleavage/methylation domain-containing protein